MARRRRPVSQSQPEDQQPLHKPAAKPAGPEHDPALRPDSPTRPTPDALLGLQRTVGNRVVNLLISGTPPRVQRGGLFADEEKGGGSAIDLETVKGPTSPADMLPVPYPNIALPAAGGGTRQVKVNNQPIMPHGSPSSRSSGDEPGTLGGMKSFKTSGAAAGGVRPPFVLPSQQKVLFDFGGTDSEEKAAPPTAAPQEEEEAGTA